MIKTALRKDALRDIKKSLGRFISILAIVALGVAFFSGLKIAPQDMKNTADKYYDDFNLMDIRVVSNLGLTDEDLVEIRKIEGVEGVFGTYSLDALAEYKEKEVVLRVHGLPLDKLEDDNKDYINRVKLIEGRMPEKSGECVIERGKNDYITVPLGTVIKFSSGKDAPLSDNLKTTEYRVVGTVQTPYYLSFEKGNSNIGTGQVKNFIMIPQEDFKVEVFTEIFATVRGARELNSYKDDYFDVVNKVTEKIKVLAKEREVLRYEDILREAKEELEKGRAEYLKEKGDAEGKLAKALKEIEDGKLEIIKGEKNLAKEERDFNLSIKEGKEKIAKGEADLAKGLEEYEKNLKTFNENRAFLPEEQVLKSEEELTKAKYILSATKEQLEKEKLKLKEGEEKGLLEFRKGREKLEKSKIDLKKGEEEYKTSKEKADREFLKALKEIEDGEKELEKIEKGKWYVLDRKSHYSYVDYGGAADRIDALSGVFPVFFALIAALVCLTTMTRMVDEQRVNIGTLKALGYGKGDIAFKYMFYALAATSLGCVIGIAVGFTVFPIIVFNAYGIMYVLPPVTLSFNGVLAISISLGAISIMTMAAFFACINELRESPSALMRPRAPKEGKRILLERIPFIWNRLNFSGKVTTRNIFRYKRRFFMTVFGIAGCTALMLTAFGIKDSIRTLVDRQFGTLFTYNMTARLESEGVKYVEEENRIDSYELIFRESGSLSLNDVKKDISIVVPRDLDNIENFIHLQERQDEKEIKIPEDGVVITEQVGRALGAKVGDEIKLINNEDNEALVKVSAITENYLFNYVYLSPSYYKEVFKKEVEFNEALGILKDTSKDFEDNLSRELMEKEGISNVSFNTAIKENFEDTIRSLNYVVIVMIVFAGALAFVVLYNLTNVNISERIREIATIKVLGFYDNEVSAYIYRENTILTLIGTLVGLFMGVFLHRFIMTTVEMENMMFGLKLSFKSYIISTVLTLVFAISVNMTMYYKLKNVEMVESLKSVD